MSKWKNRHGKTVLRNTVAAHHSSRPVELLLSPALQALSRSAHLALIRIELELRRHAGRCNGKLIVTKEQFTKFNIHPKMVAPALRELEALGIIRIDHGRGGNAEHRQPNRFLLNYLCGAIDNHGEITNTWKHVPGLKEARFVAAMARMAKDPTKVSFGRRRARRKNISQVHKVTLKPGALSDPETVKSPGALSDPTAQGHSVTPLSILSGGGGAEGGPFLSEAKPRPTAITANGAASASNGKCDPDSPFRCEHCNEAGSPGSPIHRYDRDDGQTYFYHPNCWDLIAGAGTAITAPKGIQPKEISNDQASNR